MTSGAYGHTLGAACGLGIVAAEALGESGLEVDCGGTRVGATLSVRPFYDPTGGRLRA
jgi:glycine cleavage system aminomethyltransferase T